jgi:tetratricopeptide (TPR) repeat protein
LVLAAIAIVALAAWPAFNALRVQAGAAEVEQTAAPVIADYLRRNAIVAIYEGDVRRDPSDQIMTRILASQYLARYREHFDVADALRAERFARTSLTVQPAANPAAEMTLAAALTALHQFREAQQHAQRAWREQPWDPGAASTVASLDIELGDYAAAARILNKPISTPNEIASWDTVAARFDELTGRLQTARDLVGRASRDVDEVIDNPAEARAWYHWRQGDLAFEAGDIAGAERDERDALGIYPEYAKAWGTLARIYWAQKLWPQTLDAATKASNLVPLPEYLDYKADAQRGLGNQSGYQQTRDLIRTIEFLGNVKGINDRLIATFYDEHGIYLDDALKIAQRDLAARDDIFSEDTLAWALAQKGLWYQARLHAERAVRLGTPDARLQFHAAVIAMHTGHEGEARRRFEYALSLNPRFHPVYADDARRLLARLFIARPLLPPYH